MRPLATTWNAERHLFAGNCSFKLQAMVLSHRRRLGGCHSAAVALLEELPNGEASN